MTESKDKALIQRINEIDREISSLRDEHESNRAMIAPVATRQLQIWRGDLDCQEGLLLNGLRNQIDMRQFARIDFGHPSSVAYLFRDLIEQRLARLAFLAHGPSALILNRAGREFRDCLQKIDELNDEKSEISRSLKMQLETE